jgi:hypothetical protein
MSQRRDTNGMTEKQILTEIYNTVEILDDIVRGDVQRDMKGLQPRIAEIERIVGEFQKSKLVRQTIITSAASLITLLASLATIITIAWQGSGN